MPPLFESLEPRRLLSVALKPGNEPLAYLDGAVLEVVAARAGSVIQITTRNSAAEVVVAFSGRVEQVFSRAAIGSIRITGSDLPDRITIRESAGRLNVPLDILGRSGADYIDLDLTSAVVSGGRGNDTLLGSAGDDKLNGDSGNDRVFGGAGFDLLIGGSGNDDLRGDEDDDELYGHSGNDLLDGGIGSDLLDGGSGRNRLVDYASVGEINTFFGGKGENKIYATTTDVFFNLDPWCDLLFLSPPRQTPRPEPIG